MGLKDLVYFLVIYFSSGVSFTSLLLLIGNVQSFTDATVSLLIFIITSYFAVSLLEDYINERCEKCSMMKKTK